MFRTIVNFVLFALLVQPAGATIVSSVIVEDAAQIDGRRHVTELHTDHLGATIEIKYMAAAGANVTTTMNARVASLEAQQTTGEIAANVANALSDDTPAPIFNYSTAADFSAALRVAFKTATGRDAFRIGWYIESFDLTNVQLQNLFGISSGQVAAAQTKLDTLAAQYEAMQIAVGQ